MRRLILPGIDAFALALVAILAARADLRLQPPSIQTDPAAVRAAYTGIVLGCRVNGEAVSCCLRERMEAALQLHRGGRVQRLLLTGDHGRRKYDEVNAMRTWLEERGVPREHIFLDHAGFDTYDSMVRAKKVFEVTDAIVVSQRFHLPRALYLARHAGLRAEGLAADPASGSCCGGSAWREHLAVVKAAWDVRSGSKPHFLGPAIPITGDPAASFDR